MLLTDINKMIIKKLFAKSLHRGQKCMFFIHEINIDIVCIGLENIGKYEETSIKNALILSSLIIGNTYWNKSK